MRVDAVRSADTPNPWLTPAAPVAAPMQAPPSLTRPGERHGASRPQTGVSAPDVVDRLRHRLVHNRAVWLVGAHGGAGTSTLERAVLEARDAERAWPFYAGATPPARVLLVARTSAYGLSSARTAAQEWAASTTPNVDLFGLVLVPDAPGRLPRPLRELAQLVGGGVPRVWLLPWHEPWRLGQPVTPESAPPAYKKLAGDVGAPTHPSYEG